MSELHIEIANIDDGEATELLHFISDKLSEIVLDREHICSSTDTEAAPKMKFYYGPPKPKQVFRGEDSTFSRYINGTKKE